MTTATVAPYGAWESPFPISLLTAGVVALAEVKAEGYCQVFGFEPADPIAPIRVEFLAGGPDEPRPTEEAGAAGAAGPARHRPGA